MKSTTSRILIAVLVLTGSGCATNPYTQYYQASKATNIPSLLPYSGKTQVFSTTKDSVRRNVDDLMRRGYVAIGQASFEGGDNYTEQQILEQAKAVGADIVLAMGEFAGVQQMVVPYVTVTPGQTSTTYSSGSASANISGNSQTTYQTPYGLVNASGAGSASGHASYSGTSTTTTSPTFQTQMVPVTVNRYSYSAGFFRRRTYMFGAYYDAIPTELRQTLQRNAGVIVLLVVDNTPAFRANLLPGDVIISFRGQEIQGPDALGDAYERAANEEVEVGVLRKSELKLIKVKIGPKPDAPAPAKPGSAT